MMIVLIIIVIRYPYNFNNLLDETCIHQTFVNKSFPYSIHDNVQLSINCEVNLKEFLQWWAITSGISHNSVTKLLHILCFYHPELPLDARTLLRTPITMQVTLETGIYCHLGLIKALESTLVSHPEFAGDTLDIALNIDGLPLFKSTNSQLWPILAQIKNYKSNPFPIGIFFGQSKPQPLELYLENLIGELKVIISNGISFKGKTYLPGFET